MGEPTQKGREFVKLTRAEIDKARNIPLPAPDLTKPLNAEQLESMKQMREDERAKFIRDHQISAIISQFDRRAAASPSQPYIRIIHVDLEDREIDPDLLEVNNGKAAYESALKLSQDNLFKILETGREEAKANPDKQVFMLADQALGKYIADYCQKNNHDLNTELFITKALVASTPKPQSKEAEKELTAAPSLPLNGPMPEPVKLDIRPETAPIRPDELPRKNAPTLTNTP